MAEQKKKSSSETKAKAPVVAKSEPVAVKAVTPVKTEAVKAETAKTEAKAVDQKPAQKTSAVATKSVAKTEEKKTQPVKKAASKASKKSGASKKKKPAAKKAAVKSSPKKVQKKVAKKSVKKSKTTKAPAKKAAKSATGTSFNPNQQFKTMENVMTQGKTQFDKLAKEAANESQKHAEAVAKAGNILFKGAEDYLKTYVTFAQKSAEKSQEAVKAILGCKTLNELTETQNKLAQESFDEFMSGFTKLSEISVKVATDAFEPINDQLSKSIKKATDTLAA